MSARSETVSEFVVEEVENHVYGTDEKYKGKILWVNCFGLAVFHLLALYGVYELVYHAKYQTAIYCKLIQLISIYLLF